MTVTAAQRIALAAVDAMQVEHCRRSGEPPPHDDWDEWTPDDGDALDAVPLSERERRPTGRTVATVASVLDRWSADGPVLHEPTGIALLDELTGGGPVYGTRWYLAGAPDAGKTALVVQIAHQYARRGIAVGLLAVDEDDGDIVTRLAQRGGWSRHHCEVRDPGVLAEMRQAFAGLPIHLYDEEWTIEAAAADLASHARDGRAMLGIDSVQTVPCDAELGTELTEVAAVTARVRAIRAVASRHRLIAIATSEQVRASYAPRDASQRTSALASGKWSGAIEYSARVLLALSSLPGESDLVAAEIAKNKHGPRTRDDGEPGHVYLRLDRRSQTLTAASYDPPPPTDGSDARAVRERGRATADAELVLGLIAAEPGICTRDLYAAARAAHGLGRPRVDAAVRALGERIDRRPGPRESRRHYPAGGAP